MINHQQSSSTTQTTAKLRHYNWVNQLSLKLSLHCKAIRVVQQLIFPGQFKLRQL